ncbi:hypothetical protein LRN67_11015, partial [Escherichia coli]|uniref:hypothetical protein n=1 Tax=Escherichia coli TaxID=562 RepID=UPI001F2699BE
LGSGYNTMISHLGLIRTFLNSGEIGFDKNIRFLSFSNEIMEEISHFYINMRITAVSLSN